MVILKEFELNINQDSISFHSNRELVSVWYDKAKSYFRELQFEIYDEKKLNRETCSQFKVKRDDSNNKQQGEYYVLNFFCTGRTLVQTKHNQSLFLEKHIPALEKKYEVCFKIKNQKTKENNLDKLDKIKEQQIQNSPGNSTNITTSRIPHSTAALNILLPKENPQISDTTNNENTSNILHSETSPSCLHKNSNSQRTFENAEKENEHGTASNIQPREIITSLPKHQKEFNHKIETEQVKITEELNNLKEETNRKISEILEPFKKEIGLLKQENVDLKKKLEDIQKEIQNKGILKEETRGLNKKLEDILKAQKRCNLNSDNNKKDNNNIKSLSEIKLEHEKLLSSLKNNFKTELEKLITNVNDNKLDIEKLEENYLKSAKTIQDIEEYLNSAEDTWIKVPCSNTNKTHVTTEHNNINNQNQEKDCFKLVIFGDSIVTRIKPEAIMKCDENRAINLSKRGGKVKDVYKQIEYFKEEYKSTKVENVIVHVGSNHIPRESPKDIVKKLCKLLQRVKAEFSNAKIFFSGILLKFGYDYFDAINFINEEVFNFCETIGIYFIFHNKFCQDGLKTLFWTDKIHPNSKGLKQLAFDFIDNLRYQKI